MSELDRQVSEGVSGAETAAEAVRSDDSTVAADSYNEGDSTGYGRPHLSAKVANTPAAAELTRAPPPSQYASSLKHTRGPSLDTSTVCFCSKSSIRSEVFACAVACAAHARHEGGIQSKQKITRFGGQTDDCITWRSSFIVGVHEMDVSVTHKTQNNSRAIIILEKAFGGAGSEHLQAFRAIEKLSVVDYRQGTIELLGAVQGLADPGLVIDSISHKSFALVESRLSV